MNSKTKRKVKDKTRTAYGMLHVLKDDIENMRIDANAGDYSRLILSVSDTRETIQKLLDEIVEMEYYLYLSKLEESI